MIQKQKSLTGESFQYSVGDAVEKQKGMIDELKPKTCLGCKYSEMDDELNQISEDDYMRCNLEASNGKQKQAKNGHAFFVVGSEAACHHYQPRAPQPANAELVERLEGLLKECSNNDCEVCEIAAEAIAALSTPDAGLLDEVREALKNAMPLLNHCAGEGLSFGNIDEGKIAVEAAQALTKLEGKTP